MYCVYMSQEHLDEEPAEQLYGHLVDENYNFRPSGVDEADIPDDKPSFLQSESDTEVDLLTGDGSE